MKVKQEYWAILMACNADAHYARNGARLRLLKAAADSSLRGILGYEERPLVSVDYKDDRRSAIVDAPSTMVVDGTQVKILAWYDNEWGYANRLVELARKVALSLDTQS